MNTKNNDPTGGISRRKFLKAIGTGVVALGMPNALAVRTAHAAQQAQRTEYAIREDRFRSHVPSAVFPFAESSPELKAALLEIGKPGGILDAKDFCPPGLRH